MRKILVVGAGGALGMSCVRELRAKGCQVTASYRTDRPGLLERISSLGAAPVQADLREPSSLHGVLRNVEAAIFTPILTQSIHAAPILAEGQRGVFFSSNNVTVDPAASVYAALLQAEAQLTARRPNVAILRPTMIYGYPGDGNLSRLMTAMRRRPFAPMPGRGAALQQPIFYDDLARIAVDIALKPNLSDKILTIAGPSPISQKELYEAVAAAGGVRPFIFGAPLGLAMKCVAVLEALGVNPPLSAAQLARAEKDKIPLVEPIIYGRTSLPTGLRHLAQGLDGAPAGA